MFSKSFLVLCGLSFFVFLSCSTSPSGRKQLRFLPEQQMSQMGDQAFTQMKSKSPVLGQNTKEYKTSRCVVDYLLKAMDLNPKEWQVEVFKDNTPNAFALPGNNVGIHTGMMDLVENVDQFAAVVGHEIGHVLARHGNERASQQLLVQGGLVAADMYLGRDSQTDALLMGALGLGAQVGILLPFSRKQETEADELGLKYMAEAGFDPRQASRLWVLMGQKAGGSPPEFLSTHPSSSSRAKNLENKASQYVSVFQKNKNKQNCAM